MREKERTNKMKQRKEKGQKRHARKERELKKIKNEQEEKQKQVRPNETEGNKWKKKGGTNKGRNEQK